MAQFHLNRGDLERRRDGLRAWVVLALLVLLVAACGGGGGEETVAPLPENQVRLVCSEECAARAQCGLANGSPVVLLRQEGPEVSGHNLMAPEGTVATRIDAQPREVVQTSTGQPLLVTFIRVQVPEQAIDGWVVQDWCTTR
jgi:hypothetical protein